MPIVPPLVGRDDVLQLLDGRIAAARERSSSAVVLLGEAGIGKSALLEHCQSAAEDFTVLAARGVPAEEHLSFAVLYDLLAPVIDVVERLPSRQGEVIKSALSIGPVTEAGRFEVAVAVLSALAMAAEDRPLLVVVDDAQWVDESSLSCLTFVTRRLHSESILALFALRVSDRPYPQEASAAATLGSLEHQPIGRLSQADAVRLLKLRYPDLRPDRANEIVIQAMGNPLALSVLTRSTSSHVEDSGQLDERLRSVFQDDLKSLAGPARSGLDVMAVAGDGPASQLPVVLGQLGLDLDCLEEAEESGLVRQVGSRFVFSHPLVRFAVISTLPGPRLRQLHRAIARALEGSEAVADQERRLWHLAASTSSPDEQLASQMEKVAVQALSRSSSASAVRLLERAASLSASIHERSRRLIMAADLVQAAGLVSEADRLLEEARAASLDPSEVATVEHLRCRFDMWRGQPVRARDTLLRLAAGAASTIPESAARMYASAALTSISLADMELAEWAIARADELSAELGSAILTVEAVGALLDFVHGSPEHGRERLQRCAEEISSADPLATEMPTLVFALCRFVDDDVFGALNLIENAVDLARAASAVGLLPFLLSRLALVRLAAGRWGSALACADESVQLAGLTGWTTELPYGLACLARVEAAMGRVDDCRRHAQTTIDGAQDESHAVLVAHANSALGLLELGNANLLAAIGHLEAVAEFAREHGMANNPIVPWAEDLLEAYARAGDTNGAQTLLVEMDAELRRSARPRLQCALDRCRGLLARYDSEAETLLERSIETATAAAAPFEKARSLLCLGQVRRRHRHPRDARRPLASALAQFEQLGASTWREQARLELRAIGSTTSGPDPGLTALTPQELSVAQSVAEGLTNQQAANRLFLSARTVEFHLSNAYRKLGIGRRAQLVRLVANSHN
jgi:DNA-binding CsgD family transcriptional regulator